MFVYRFDWDEEPTLLGAELRVMLGAGHGFEIPFVFGHWDLGPRANVMFTDGNLPGRTALSAQMMAYWAAFARGGRPGTGRNGSGPEWEPFAPTPGVRRYMVFDTKEGGGTRMQTGLLDMAQVLAGVKADPRLRNAEERCTVLRAVVQGSPLLDPSAYESAGGAECKAYPLGASR